MINSNKQYKLNTKRAKKSIIWSLSKDEFVKIVKDSESIGQILKHFGLKNKGRNNETIKRRCLEDGIDISHIKLGINSNRGRKFFTNKIPLSEILVENSNYNRTHLKNRLIKEKILEYKCYKCNNIGIWLERKLSLQLEHKNGNSKDNRIENLTLLCPNCHSQTKTFAGRNKNILS